MINILIAIGVCFAISAVLGICIALADKYLRVEEDPRIEVVTSLLAGANCGGCGNPGCASFAQKIVSKEVSSLNACRPTNAQKKEQIKEYLKNTPGPDGTTIELK